MSVPTSPSVERYTGKDGDVDTANDLRSIHVPPQTARKHGGIIEIAPITTFNNWVLIMPFNIDTNLELPSNATHRNIGIVVGRSDTIMAQNGQRVPSVLECGMVVMFQKNANIGSLTINKEPYVDRKIIIVNEVNVICRLPSVPFKVLDTVIGVDDFAIVQPDR